MMKQRKYAVAARIYAEAARLSPADSQYLLAGRNRTGRARQASTLHNQKQLQTNEPSSSLKKVPGGFGKA